MQRQEVVIGGWLPGEGRREESIGSLAVGYYDGEDLKYAGNVGTGFKEADLVVLKKLLAPLRSDTSPFAGRQPKKGTVFVEPKLVAEAEFLEWTRTGTLRAPSFKGLRDDRNPRTVVREVPGVAARLRGVRRPGPAARPARRASRARPGCRRG